MPRKTEDLTGQLYRLRESGRLPQGDEQPVDPRQSLPTSTRAMAFDGFRWAVWGLFIFVVLAQLAGVVWWALR